MPLRRQVFALGRRRQPASAPTTATPWNWFPASRSRWIRSTRRRSPGVQEFVTEYSQYWRRYFDPIAIRLQVTPKQYRAETIILPLIDNSIYTGMATSLGGEPEPLDALPVPEKNIFSVAVRLEQGPAAEARAATVRHLPRHRPFRFAAAAGQRCRSRSSSVKGLGNQIGMHVYDAAPMFDLNLTGLLGEMLGTFRSGSGASTAKCCRSAS